MNFKPVNSPLIFTLLNFTTGIKLLNFKRKILCDQKMKASLFIKNLSKVMWHSKLTYIVDEPPEKLAQLLKKVYKAEQNGNNLMIGLRTIKIEPFSSKKSLVRIY